MSQDAWYAAIEAENSELRHKLGAALAQNALLLERVQELEARLAKDSHNSSKPPSSDGLARKTKSLRKRSGKKPGGQPGHRGHQVRLVATPDTVVVHRPERCGTCQQALPEDAPGWVARPQVHELPTVSVPITAHR